MSDPVDHISRELRGKTSYDAMPRTNRQRNKSKPGRPAVPTYEIKASGPVAGQRPSEVAQRWMDQAEERGYHPPFNANWLALKIAAKVEHDKELIPYLNAGRHQDVKRWLDKMTDKFWDEYVDESIKDRDLSGFFLEECWDDLREYAFICLRAAYLKEHGVAKPPVEASPWYEQQIHKQMKEAKFKVWLEEQANDKTPPLPDRSGQTREERVRSIKEKLRAGAEKRRAAREEDE